MFCPVAMAAAACIVLFVQSCRFLGAAPCGVAYPGHVGNGLPSHPMGDHPGTGSVGGGMGYPFSSRRHGRSWSQFWMAHIEYLVVVFNFSGVMMFKHISGTSTL